MSNSPDYCCDDGLWAANGPTGRTGGTIRCTTMDDELTNSELLSFTRIGNGRNKLFTVAHQKRNIESET